MKKVSRAALYLGGAILALLATALLAVNLYVQSHTTQERIQRELSERLGTTLRIQRISITPWSGLKLTGITMPQEGASPAADFLRAETFRLRVRFGSLFAQRLVIKEVSLVKPTVTWAQNEDGKWRLPSSLRADEATTPAPATSDPVPEAQPVAPATRGPGAAPEEPGDNHVAAVDRPFTPEVRRVNLTGGNFHFLDAQNNPVATFEGVRFRSDFRNATALRGNANIAKVSLRDRFFLERLQSPLEYDPMEMDFSKIRAEAAGGEVTGRFTMRPMDPGSPFKVMVKFRELEAGRVISEARGPLGMLEGRIEGQLEASGKTSDPNALSGTGEIHLRDGQVRQYSLLVTLGQLLQIEELTQLRFQQAAVKYHIDPGVITVDELILSSPNIRISAVGTIGFDGKLRLKSRLALDERIRGQLFRQIQDNFKPIEEPGFAALDFKVSGTIERPKSDLMDKLVGDELKDLSGAISSLLGRGKKDRKKKKPTEDQAAGAAAPTTIPPAVATAAPGSSERVIAPPALPSPAAEPAGTSSPGSSP